MREEYWQIAATLTTPRNDQYIARLVAYDGKKLGKARHWQRRTGGVDQGHAGRRAYKALSVEAKPVKRTSGPPFTTSTLQQAASGKLGYSPNRTMQIAQKLYEGIDIGGETVGLITYMRTDGVQMAPEAIDGARAMIGSEFGERYVPEKPRYFTNKAKNAQEAHEAIRPTDFFRHPKEMRKFLDDDMAKLYDLIWKRAVASQMQAAEMERTTAEIEAANGGKTAVLARCRHGCAV